MDAGRVVGMTYPPETRPGSCAGRRFREEVRNEQETTHAGADPALREAEVGLARGKTVRMVIRELGISEQTY